MEDSKKLSEKLQALIIPPHDLALNLTNGLYATHKPIALDYLEAEAYNGIMSKEQFRELCIQDFLKTSAKIWEKDRASVNVWQKVLELYSQYKFLAFTGNSFSKATIVEEMKGLNWRLNGAMEWFEKHENISPLPPLEYLDLMKKTEEGGFEYTRHEYNDYLNSQISEQNKSCSVISCIHRQNVV